MTEDVADGEAGPSGGDRPHVVFAPLRIKDLRAVLRIEEAVFTEPWSHRLFVEELSQRRTRAYRAAWIDNRIVGFAGQMFVDEETHVNTIAVDPTHQGKGLGAALLADLVRTGLDHGARHLTLEVRVGNEPAIALYRRFGMAPVGIRPNYYPVTGEDALVMWVRDIDDPTFAERLTAIEADVDRRLSIETRR
jgi:[ribosomal protein S18]-alanine N-acetyltransferase